MAYTLLVLRGYLEPCNHLCNVGEPPSQRSTLCPSSPSASSFLNSITLIFSPAVGVNRHILGPDCQTPNPAQFPRANAAHQFSKSNTSWGRRQVLSHQKQRKGLLSSPEPHPLSGSINSFHFLLQETTVSDLVFIFEKFSF